MLSYTAHAVRTDSAQTHQHEPLLQGVATSDRIEN